jgi:hypothetical protein
MRQLCVPSDRVLRGVVEDAVFDGLKHHAICLFDLAVAPWVGHQRVVDADEAVLVEIEKSDPVKAFPRSVTILLGTPNRWVMSSMNFATSFDVTVSTRRTSIHLVNLSTATRMCL